MIRNIVIFVMSPFSPNGQEKVYAYKGEDFSVSCLHTNETVLKYIDWKLSHDKAYAGQRLDAVYAFVSDAVRESSFNRFCALFPDREYEIQPVLLVNNGDLYGSMESIIGMFDVMQAYSTAHAGDDICVHVDMTGGPRHASMLLLALLQLLKYRGIETGMVLYTNYQSGMIENAASLMDMYTLVSGAEEFTAYGRVMQIQKYLYSNIYKSKQLSQLLEQMENVSEVIKVCGNYWQMQATLQALGKAIQVYKEYCREFSTSLSAQEQLFSKLLVRIEEEYMSILPAEGKESSPLAIIKWCIRRDMLQQAVTFYTEWTPRYIIDSGLVYAIHPDVIDLCRKKGQMWSCWQIYFFRNYMPTAQAPKDDTYAAYNDLTYDEINSYIQKGYSLKQIQSYVKGKNELFDKFLKEAIGIEFCVDNYIERKKFINKVINLPSKHILRHIFENARTDNITLKSFLYSRLSKVRTLEELILSSLKQAGRDKTVDLFQLSGERVEATIEQKMELRKWAFRTMLAEGTIQTKLSPDNLITFAALYTQYVDTWRNSFNHSGKFKASKMMNEYVKNSILQSIDLLQENIR